MELNDAYKSMMEFVEMDVTYGTNGWTNRQRADLTEALLDAKIPHEWTGVDLIVTREHEATVDRFIGRPRR